MKSLTREVTPHIRTDAQGGPFNPVFGVKTPHEINEMKEEILCNKHFITIGGKSIFYKAWASRGIQILNDLLDSHGVLFRFENFKSNRERCSVLHIYAGRLAAIPQNYIHIALSWQP